MPSKLGVIFYLLTASVLVAAAAPRCQKDGELLQDPADCSAYWRCSGSTPVASRCEGDEVFSKTMNVCVPRHSPLDDCSDTNTRSVSAVTANPCHGRSGLVADPRYCHRYHNCSDGSVRHCQYRQLFSETTNSCLPYGDVYCGKRLVEKNPCRQGLSYGCPRAHCIPCEVYNDDCFNKADGIHAQEGRPNSPFYAICQDGWFYGLGRCDMGIFSASSRRCFVPRY